MDIEEIKANAPEDAAFWSPAVEQYFDRQYMNLAFKEQGKLIQVEKPFRAELVPLTK
ncbi:hypothetical protein [Vibrio sonorensis]|uniref:hypothetical protein n=1 Tax=Vibrio sonorensis TaxID=1004316 RepID=UPI001586CE8E|nr:hypothetical protein [Vibrio sonorensis]